MPGEGTWTIAAKMERRPMRAERGQSECSSPKEKSALETTRTIPGETRGKEHTWVAGLKTGSTHKMNSRQAHGGFQDRAASKTSRPQERRSSNRGDKWGGSSKSGGSRMSAYGGTWARGSPLEWDRTTSGASLPPLRDETRDKKITETRGVTARGNGRSEERGV